MTEKTAKVLLASVILARSSSFAMNKICLTDIDVFNLMGIRFLMAFLLMAILFNKKLRHADKTSILSGFIVGTAFFIVMSLEVSSLRTCDSSTTAILENTAIVIVPIFEAVLLRKLPIPKVMIGFIMAMTGVILMTMNGSSSGFSVGHILAIGSAISYAAAIIITDRITKGSDALVIGIIQLGTIGSLAAIGALLFETPHLPNESSSWIAIMLLVVVCSCFGFTLQPVAQKYTSSETAGLYCALSPLGSAVIGWIFLNEDLSTRALLGAILVIFSILIVQKSQ